MLMQEVSSFARDLRRLSRNLHAGVGPDDRDRAAFDTIADTLHGPPNERGGFRRVFSLLSHDRIQSWVATYPVGRESLTREVDWLIEQLKDLE